MFTQQSPATRGKRPRSLALVLGVLALSLGLSTTPASATEPESLSGSGYVHDSTGTLSASDVERVNDRLTQLHNETEVDLYVVYVGDFTAVASSEEWANTTADLSGLGPSQYLLAIAVDGRQLYLSGDSRGPLSEAKLIAAEDAALDAGDAENFSAAPIAAADSMTASLAKPDGSIFTWALVAIASIVGIVLLVMALQRRKRRKRAQGDLQASLRELERAAGSTLVQTDDAIKTSVDELGFARAQFGDDVTREYEEALTSAKKNLDAAFSIKQQLDDEIPDTYEQKVEWNQQIIQLLNEANVRLDEKAESFDKLRELEQNAPAALAAVTALRDEKHAAQATAEVVWTGLQERYSPSALDAVRSNVNEATLRLQFANEQLQHASESIEAGQTAEAAVAIRASEDAVTQAGQLQTALSTLAASLSDAEQRTVGLIAELEQDIITAQALPDNDGRISQVVASTRMQITNAQSALARQQSNPLQAAEALDVANTTIDGVVGEVRDALARAEHARRQLESAMATAQAQVSAAEDFITTRRGAVGSTARTRIAEARVSLARAYDLQTADPERALAEAKRAIALANDAMGAAQQDVGMWGESTNGGSNDVLSAVLGGVILNSIFGGGSSRGSSRGSSGISFGSRSGGSSGGGFRSGSFGGGGTRSRRGGGRF